MSPILNIDRVCLLVNDSLIPKLKKINFLLLKTDHILDESVNNVSFERDAGSDIV